MTQEEKQLLLKDLCARLPYGVICSVEHKEDGRWKTEDMKLSGISDNDYFYFTDEMGSAYSDTFKPYLRPMSSMTKKEENEFISLNSVPPTFWLPNHTRMSWYSNATMIDWLLEHHFDFRGLIEKGLALEAPKDMYKEE